MCLAITAIPSPTGTERPLAEWIVERLRRTGIDADLQVFDETRANVVARRPGRGDGRSLLLYSSIDTAFPIDRDATGGAPGAGDTPPLAPGARRSGDWIVGPGAENPKGFATAVIGAFEALCASPLDLAGDVVLALTAGGMPTPDRPDRPGSGGLGRGCREFLEHGARPDAAVIAKPGDAVSTEEVGIALFRLRVSGDLGYTGTRHRGPVRHAVRDAARLVERLETWFPVYTAERATATLAPQGAVTAIAGGWPDRPAFLPAACDVWVDLRTVPGMTLDDARAALQAVVDGAAADLDCDVAITLLGGFPGASTPADAPIVRSAIRAWESRTGRQHVPITGTSGVTDASILRAAGIPTARIGMPRPAEAAPYPGFSMGVVSIGSMAALAETLVDIAVDTVGPAHSTPSSVTEINA